MSDYQMYYNIRKAQFVLALEEWTLGKYLSPEELIALELGYASDFVGMTVTSDSDTAIRSFQEATRSVGQPWAISFIAFILNQGISKTMSNVASLYTFPLIVPATPYITQLLEWAKVNNYLTSFPCSGDIAILYSDETKYSIGLVVSISGKAKKIKTIEGDAKVRGEKHRGIFEVERNLKTTKGEFFFIDMRAIFSDFLKQAQQISKMSDPLMRAE